MIGIIKSVDKLTGKLDRTKADDKYISIEDCAADEVTMLECNTYQLETTT